MKIRERDYLLSTQLGKKLELVDINVAMKSLVKARNPPAIGKLQCKITLLLR